jgi:hypothetical protein
VLWAQAGALLQQLKVAALLGGALRARPGRRLALVPLHARNVLCAARVP